jgi:hypothetical protein
MAETGHVNVGSVGRASLALHSEKCGEMAPLWPQNSSVSSDRRPFGASARLSAEETSRKLREPLLKNPSTERTMGLEPTTFGLGSRALLALYKGQSAIWPHDGPGIGVREVRLGAPRRATTRVGAG